MNFWKISIIVFVIIISLPLVFVLLFKAGMGVLHIFTVSAKQAKKELTEIIEEKHQAAWRITNIERFFNEGNMNPNMFYVELETVDSPHIEFVVFWDAKLKEERKAWDGEEYTLQGEYNRAYEEYLKKESIKQAICVEAEVALLSYWSIELKLDIDPTVAEMRETTKVLNQLYLDEMQEKSDYMNLFFTSNQTPDNLYYTQLYKQPMDEPYIFMNRLSKDAKLEEVVTKSRAILKEHLAAEHKTYNLDDYLYDVWLNQGNINEFYGTYQVTMPTVEGDVRPATQELKGWMLFKYDMETGEVLHYEFIAGEEKESHQVVKLIEAQIPQVYHYPVKAK